jgi:hypothetical protein
VERVTIPGSVLNTQSQFDYKHFPSKPEIEMRNGGSMKFSACGFDCFVIFAVVPLLQSTH